MQVGIETSSMAEPGAARSSHGHVLAVLVPGDDLAKLGPLLASFGLDVFTPERLAKECFVQTGPNGAPVSAEIPAHFVGAVAGSPQGARALGEARDRLALFFDTFGFDVLDLASLSESDSGNALSAWLARRLVLVGNIVVGDGSRVRQATVTLRQEHEEAMERFRTLEASTARFSTPKRVLRLNLPTSRNNVRLGSKAAGDRTVVRQLVPTPAGGIACIELQPSGPPTGRGGVLQVEMFAGGTTTAVRRWTVPAERIRGGWLPLFLDKALVSREQDAVLEITWQAEGSQSLSLNLSRPVPIDELCGALDGGARLQAPLALKVWGMAPGATVSEVEFAASAAVTETSVKSSSPERVRFALGTNDLRSVDLLSPLKHGLSYNLVEYRQSEMDVLVHPIVGKTTVAIVRDISVRYLERLSALAHVGHSAANPVEFGLAAVTHDSIYGPPEAVIRHWTVVEPQIYTEIAGSVDVTHGKPVDLILATRMLDDADPNLAWAYFKRVEMVA